MLSAVRAFLRAASMYQGLLHQELFLGSLKYALSTIHPNVPGITARSADKICLSCESPPAHQHEKSGKLNPLFRWVAVIDGSDLLVSLLRPRRSRKLYHSGGTDWKFQPGNCHSGSRSWKAVKSGTRRSYRTVPEPSDAQRAKERRLRHPF